MRWRRKLATAVLAVLTSALGFAACSSFSGSGSGSTSADANPLDATSAIDAQLDAIVIVDAGARPSTDADATAADPFPCNDAGECFLKTGLDHPSSLAVNDTLVYTAEKVSMGRVYALPKDGSEPQIVFTGDMMSSVQLVGASAYVCDTNDNFVYTTAPDAGPVPFTQPAFLAADDAGVFVASSGTSEKTAYYPPNLSAAMQGNETRVMTAIALSPKYLYVSYVGGNVSQYLRSPVFSDTQSFPVGQAIALAAPDDVYVYVVDQTESEVLQFNAANCNAAPVPIAKSLSSSTLLPVLAVDSQSIYAADGNGLYEVGIGSHNPMRLASDANITGIAVDSTYVYFSVEGLSNAGSIQDHTGYVARVAK